MLNARNRGSSVHYHYTHPHFCTRLSLTPYPTPLHLPMTAEQRVCTSWGEMGGVTLLPCKVEPNWPLPYNLCQYNGWGMPGWRAGSPVSVYVRVHCREPKTGQQMVQFYCEDDWLWPSCYCLSMRNPHPSHAFSIPRNLVRWMVLLHPPVLWNPFLGMIGSEFGFKK